MRKRGLSRSVGSHKRVDFSRPDSKADTVEDIFIIDRDAQVFDYQVWHKLLVYKLTNLHFLQVFIYLPADFSPGRAAGADLVTGAFAHVRAQEAGGEQGLGIEGK